MGELLIWCFPLHRNLKKQLPAQNVFHQQHPHGEYYQSRIAIDQTKLTVAHHFTSLVCTVSSYSEIYLDVRTIDLPKETAPLKTGTTAIWIKAQRSAFYYARWSLKRWLLSCTMPVLVHVWTPSYPSVPSALPQPEGHQNREKTSTQTFSYSSWGRACLSCDELACSGSVWIAPIMNFRSQTIRQKY